jgi:hypothetical protein
MDVRDIHILTCMQIYFFDVEDTERFRHLIVPLLTVLCFEVLCPILVL